MPYFINRKDVDSKVRSHYLAEYKQRLKESLMDPTLSDEGRQRIRSLLDTVSQERAPEKAHASKNASFN